MVEGKIRRLSPITTGFGVPCPRLRGHAGLHRPATGPLRMAGGAEPLRMPTKTWVWHPAQEVLRLGFRLRSCALPFAICHLSFALVDPLGPRVPPGGGRCRGRTWAGLRGNPGDFAGRD